MCSIAKYDTSKFYWLQLREDFFDDDAIDWLEEQPNGKEYSLFYLKLCLKSLRTNGILIRHVGNMLIPYDHIKLGELTNTSPDTVLVALNVLVQIGLVEKMENGELYLRKVEDLIGSQSKSAFVKQQQRIRSGLSVSCGQLVDSKVDNCPPKIEIEIDIDKDIDTDIERDKKKPLKRFSAPTVNEVKEYCEERWNGIDAQRFCDYYESNGWKVGKNPMKDWKACVRTWEQRDSVKQKPIPEETEEVKQSGDTAWDAALAKANEVLKGVKL